MKLSRRQFLVGASGLAAASLLRIARSEPRRAPLRLLLVHKPVGTVSDRYAEVLEPFADLRDRMVVVEGLENRKQSNTPGEDHANGMVTFLTGGIPYREQGSSTAVASLPSIDQIVAADPRFAGTTPIRSLQLTADDRGYQHLLRVLSSAGRGMPLPPEESPLAAFARMFGTLADRALSPEDARRLRANQQSVLDFTRTDLARLRPQLRPSERDRIDRHFTAIREVEQVLHRVAEIDPLPLQRQMQAATAARDDSRDKHHGQIGRAHLELVRVAFQCDLTRVVCFTWGSWVANVAAYVPNVGTRVYHDLSHSGLSDDEVRVHRWYNEQLAAFLRTLRETPDVDGRSLLDNTLVVSWTEMRLGSHAFDNLPIQLFGGAAGRLAGGRRVSYPGYSTNDLWRTFLNAVGDRREVFGDADKSSGRLVGLFDDLPLDDFAAASSKASLAP